MASRSTVQNRFFKVKSKIANVNADIRFLKDCKRLEVFPNFICLKSNSKSVASRKAINFAKRKWLDSEIKYQYSKLGKLELEAYDLHLSLSKNLNVIQNKEWIEYLVKIEEVIQHKLVKKVASQKKKLSKLLPVKEVPPKSNPDLIVKNESSQTFNNNEIVFLNQGLKHNLNFKKAPVDEIIVGIESAIKFMDESSKNYIRNACKIQISENIQRNPQSFEFSKKDYDTIKSLRNKDCFYLKADKGNSVVIMDKGDYFNRVGDMISAGSYKELNKNPLPKMVSDTRKTITSCNKVISSEFKARLIVSNPVLPRMYCLPKIHKPGKSMRPIVSCINAPTYLLSKYLSKEFNNLPRQPENLAVKNSYEFIEKVKNIELTDNEILVSFDVTSLFPSVPVKQTLVYLKDMLLDNGLDNEKVQQFINLADICMLQNFFQFNNKYYQQCDGTAMGNSLSPFIANLFMSKFEIDRKNDMKYFPRVWIRYVDDVFAVFDTSKCSIQDFVNELNSKVPSIKFTHETEIDSKLPFLDMFVVRKGKALEIDIYRKGTSNSRFISTESNHCMQHKLASFNFLVHRLLNFPLSKENFQKELKHIKEIAIYNGFSVDIINNIIRRHRNKLELKSKTTLASNITTEGKGKFVKLPFYPRYTQGLNKILASKDLRVVYSTSNSIKNLLGNPKDSVDSMEKAGIYKITCNNCDQIYVGQTKRSLNVRYKEHLAHIKYRRPDKSSVALHMYEHGHKVKNIELVKTVHRKNELDSYESLEIFKNKNRLMNVDSGPINSILFKIL